MDRIFCCPQCKNAVRRIGNKYSCQHCKNLYPIVNGIPSFVDQDIDIGLDSFDASAFEFLFAMEQRHFWHIGRKEIILGVLRRHVPHLAESPMLEIGCGNGSVLAYLRQNGVYVEGGDIFIEALEFCQRRVGHIPLYRVDVLSLPFCNDFDVVGLFDVLEHIEEDEKALAEVSQALRAGGKVLITVPAHKSLWSYADESAHHKRRYSKVELTVKLERNGFAIKAISYYMFFLFPFMLAIRLITNALWRNRARRDRRSRIELKTIPVLNSIFLRLLRVEGWLMRYVNLPVGSSLVVLAEKKSETCNEDRIL